MKKIGGMGPRSRFFWKKKLKKCPDQKMTKGNIVLKLVKYAKSAVRNFRPIRGLHCGHVTLNGGLWLVEIFLLQIWHIWAILRPFYPWSFFDSGIISKKKSQKTDFRGPFQLPWVGWRGSTQKTQNLRRMIWKYAGIAENESTKDLKRTYVALLQHLYHFFVAAMYFISFYIFNSTKTFPKLS